MSEPVTHKNSMKSIATTKVLIEQAARLSLATGKKVSIHLTPNPLYKKDKTTPRYTASFQLKP